jgi:outer membrane protein assembly factor BamB
MSKRWYSSRAFAAQGKAPLVVVICAILVIATLVGFSAASYFKSTSTSLSTSVTNQGQVVDTSISPTIASSVVLTGTTNSTVSTTTVQTSDSSTSVHASSSTSFSVNSNSTESTHSTLTTTNITQYSSSQNNWLTYGNGNSRNGVYNYSSNLSANATIKWTQKVDAPVYAQPLYFNGTTFIATENNTVYALSSTTGSIEWSNHLGTPVQSLVPPLECNNNPQQAPDIRPTIGITGTPVIDPVSGTLYVASLLNASGFSLFAISTSNGKDVWSQSISASGFTFMPEEQRGALALANGFVYVPFGGYSWDCVPPGPIGWVIAIPASHPGKELSFAIPTTVEGDIWAPEGVSVDSSGNIYVASGDSANESFDLGNSVIKLSPELTFVNSTSNYFAATDWVYTNAKDLDLGSTGATLLSKGLVFSIGKDGIGYVLNASNLGGIGGQLYNATVCGPSGAWGSTAYSNGIIYVPCGNLGLHALSLVQTASGNYEFASLWNTTVGAWAGPSILAYGAVWSVNILGNTLFALNPGNGSVISQISLSPFEHFTTPSAGNGFIFVAANQTIYGIDAVTR